jgi:hypothetical protein
MKIFFTLGTLGILDTLGTYSTPLLRDQIPTIWKDCKLRKL